MPDLKKIRTYNYPQGRITDHRIKLTLHKLDAFLDGDLTEMIDALITFDQADMHYEFSRIMEKLINILKFSEEYLKKYSFSKPRLQAEKVVAYVLKLDRISLYAYFDRDLSEDEKVQIKNFLKEMARNRLDFEKGPRKIGK